jgi:hypothetical protein
MEEKSAMNPKKARPPGHQWVRKTAVLKYRGHETSMILFVVTEISTPLNIYLGISSHRTATTPKFQSCLLVSGAMRTW